MFYKQFFIIIYLFLSTEMLAQSFTLSPYSKFGIGDISYPSYVPGYSMGFTSLAHRSNRYINRENPAAATEIDTLTFVTDISMMGRFFTLKHRFLTHRQANTDIQYFAMGFPISNKWKVNIGLSPVSNSGYNIKEVKNIDTLELTNTYKGDGGLNEVFWSNGFYLFNIKQVRKKENLTNNSFHKLSVGIKSAFMFGSIDRYTSAVFMKDLYVFDVNKTERIIANGLDFKGSLQYQYLLQEEKNMEKHNKLKLIVGLMYHPMTSINARQTTLVTKFLNLQGSVTKDTIQNIENKKGDIKLPQSYGLGLLIETNDQFTWTGEISFYEWSKTTIFEEHAHLENSMFLATGIQYIPDPTKFYQYWKMTHYRMGVYYNQTYLKLNSHHINEFGITFGLGLPITKTDKGESTMIRRKLPPVLNVSLAYGMRGTTAHNLIKESFWQFTLSLNIHDIWFIKRKYD